MCWYCSFCCCSPFTFSFRRHSSPLCGLCSSFYAHLILSTQSIAEWFAMRHFYFQPFRYLLAAGAIGLSGHYLPIGVFYLTLTLLHWHFNLRLFNVSLGAGSSFLKFAGLHTDPRSTDPTHVFVWFTVIHNLHIQTNSALNSTICYHELLVVKV